MCHPGLRAFARTRCLPVLQGLHPRLVAEGFDLAKDHAVAFLDTFKVSKPRVWEDRELLCSVARTSLMTKLYPEMALQLTEIVTDAVLLVRKEGEPIDLNMVRVRGAEGSAGAVFWRPFEFAHRARNSRFLVCVHLRPALPSD